MRAPGQPPSVRLAWPQPLLEATCPPPAVLLMSHVTRRTSAEAPAGPPGPARVSGCGPRGGLCGCTPAGPLGDERVEGTCSPAGSPAPSPARLPPSPAPPHAVAPGTHPCCRSGKLIGGSPRLSKTILSFLLGNKAVSQHPKVTASGTRESSTARVIWAVSTPPGPCSAPAQCSAAGPGLRACGAAHATRGHAPAPASAGHVPTHSHGPVAGVALGGRSLLVGGAEPLPSLAQHGHPHSAWSCASGTERQSPKLGMWSTLSQCGRTHACGSGRRQASPLGTRQPPRPLRQPLAFLSGTS